MFVGAPCRAVAIRRRKVVNPKLLGPRFLGCGFAVEEKDVGLDALRVEDAGGQSQQGVNISLLEQLASHCFASAAFEEDVVGHNDCGAAVLLQDVKDVLEEVKL